MMKASKLLGLPTKENMEEYKNEKLNERSTKKDKKERKESLRGSKTLNKPVNKMETKSRLDYATINNERSGSSSLYDSGSIYLDKSSNIPLNESTTVRIKVDINNLNAVFDRHTLVYETKLLSVLFSRFVSPNNILIKNQEGKVPLQIIPEDDNALFDSLKHFYGKNAEKIVVTFDEKDPFQVKYKYDKFYDTMKKASFKIKKPILEIIKND